MGNVILGINIDGYFIFSVSMLIGLVSFMVRSASGSYRSWKCSLAFGIYGFINLTMRLLAMVDFYIPSLGMLDVLRHLQADKLPFTNPTINKKSFDPDDFQYKYNFSSDIL